MPIKEKCTEQIVIKALETETLASGNLTTSGAIIDTADYDNGVYFVMDGKDVTSGVTLTLELSHGDNALLSDVELVPSDNLVYPDDAVLTDDVAEGAAKPKQGVFGTKRYLRAAVVKTGGTVGPATTSVDAIVNPEIAKTPQDSL